MKTVGVIPARYGSTRLKGKILREILGKPMIQHVWNQACKATELSDLYVACDHEEIKSCVEGFGGKALLTSPDHLNGTSRIGEVANKIDAEILINIQGDEPLIHPQNIDMLAKCLQESEHCSMATLAVRKTNAEEFLNPNVVKVVCDRESNALYFSRSPIPFKRDYSDDFSFLKHIGIYGYRKEFLKKFLSLETGNLEVIEKLEQLRVLENGYTLKVVETPYDSLGVDTEEDIQLVEKILRKEKQGRE
jgi:3-deoxy-manno-octulosonate cytidylyltransferase (CMP-KDO synthetase)